MWKIVFYVLAGMLAGVLGGMGMGGGTVLIPILTLLFGMPQLQAQGINILSFIPMAIIALLVHKKNKLLDTKHFWLLLLPACLFTAVGAYLASIMPPDILKKCFGGFLIVLAVIQVVMVLSKKHMNKSDD